MSVPPWTNVPSIVWVTDHPAFDPRVPTGATVLPPEIVEAWLAEPTPCEALRMLRARGATVASAPEASRAIRTLCRRLRARLAVSTLEDLAEVAAELGATDLSAALRRFPGDIALTFANLSSAAAAPHGRLDDTARILLALEHL